MPGSSSWIPYAPQGVKGLVDDDDDEWYCVCGRSHMTGHASQYVGSVTALAARVNPTTNWQCT
jgi:hypothetical protein